MEKERKIVNFLTKKYNQYNDEHRKNLNAINENFLFELTWRVEKAYKCAFVANTINGMLNTINEGKVENYLVYLTNIRDSIINRLTTREVVESSSSMITNLCSLWETNARQDLLVILNECLEIYLED